MAGRFALESNFVVDSQDYRGIGWCEKATSAEAVVVYRDLPGEVADVVRVPPSRLTAHSLPDETRVWVKNKGFGWWPGRTRGHMPDGNYRVKLAGIGNLVPVPPWTIQVRWARPLDDPTGALRVGMTDTTGYYEARFGVMESVACQREAARGYTAVLSAAVHPFHHQLGVMTRVLGDPIMRFVLADEVGLGKTIEAGLIVRQLLLDDPSARVVIATPPHLEQQWVDELQGKLLLAQGLRSGRVKLVEHEQLVGGTTPASTMLIIDEAHGLVEQGLSDPARLARLTRVCASSAGLLLLTATPLKGHAATFLGLLHLIDPVAYDLRELGRFEERFALRHEQASAIELLAPGVPSRMLRKVLGEFRTRYADDSGLVDRLNAADAALDEGGDSQAAAMAAVADYLRETYRISRRVIRNRRSSVLADGFPVRGREAEFVNLDDPARSIVDDFLDEWRRALLDVVDPEDRAAQRLFADGVESALSGPSGFIHFIDGRTDRPFFSSTEEALFAQHRSQLRRTGSSARLDLVLRTVQELLTQAGSKIVVFATVPGVADDLVAALDEALARPEFASHLSSMATSEQDASVRRFVGDHRCRLLLCDRSGEEGRNLQVATHLFHVDLPLSINRLEQRLGRTDRFSDRETDRALSVVVAEDSPWTRAQLALLDSGVGVLNGSVATLQRPLGELEEHVREMLLAQGLAALAPDLHELRTRLDEEREQIDLLEELEATQFDSELYGAAVDDLIEFDSDSKPMESAFDTLTQAQGGVRLRKLTEPATPRVFSYGLDSSLRTVPFMPGDDLQQLLPLLPGRRTFDRTVATTTAGIAPMRVGNPLVDWLDGYLRRDEGGRAWAIWRADERAHEPTAYFRIDLVLEFDETALPEMAVGVMRRLRRRGDAFLPPRVETVWLDDHGEVEAHVISDRLDPASPTDQQLRGPLWIAALRQFPDWPDRCAQLTARAIEAVYGRPDVAGWKEAAVRQARADLDRRLRVFAGWIERLPSGPERDRARVEYETELGLDAAIEAGIASARQHVVAAGAVLMSREPLSA